MRDVIVDAYRMTAIKNKITVAANKWGKYKTIFQMLGITIIFFLFNSTGMLIFTGAHEVYRMTPIEHTWQYWVLQNGIIYVALFFSIFSGIIYIINFSKKNGTN
jgi:CDP-diacylglycerol--glycerol-3-phosphate 3-phosphatidyltransferase